MRLAWGARVSPEFRRRVVGIAGLLRIDPSWLMACIAFETGRAFDPAIRNAAGSGATGLIQFMPSTARRLGTTTDALAALTAEEQLAFVEQYFREFAGRLHSLADTYMAILWPRAVGQPDDYSIATSADGNTYLQNRGLDVDADGRITKAEAAAKVARLLDEGLEPGNVYDDGEQPAAPIDDHSTEYQEPAAPATTTEEPMGAIALPLLAQLIPQVLGLFTARAQTKIAEKTGADPRVAADFMQALIAQVGHTVGVPVLDNASATQAVAALTAAPPETRAAKVQALESQALATLDALLKAGDKMAEWDAAMWAAQLAGRQVASTIAIEERKAGLWDMTPVLVYGATILLGIVSIGLLAAILVQAMTGDRAINSALIGLAGPIWTGAVVSGFVSMVAYRFDGTKESTEQSKAVADVIRQRGAQQ